MLVKLETKSARVKGLSFHNRQPWILTSLHTGLIEIWDYRCSLRLETFQEHVGPVRSANFHTRQPLFVSGGDDYKIKVWNYKSTKSLFTLIGHYDYVRVVVFHKNHPWIASCSDDQSIKIWNWQSRSCLTTLTGHNHYVMCVEFHPSEDLLLSASLDQTIRIWQLTGLKSASDGMLRLILNGHTSGVNWACFHQHLGLIVSGGDDYVVKLWRYDDDKAWEVCSLRSHHKNVSCVIFYKNQDMVLSVGEDKTLKIWDLITKNCLHTHRRVHDRFWILSEHPEQKIFAAGHDAGMIVFKLEKERTVHCITQNSMFYIKDKAIRKYSFDSGKDVQILLLTNMQFNKSIRSISVNEGCNFVLTTFEMNNGNFFELRDLKEGKTYLYACGIVAKFISAKVYAVVENNKQLTLNYINKFDVNKVSTGLNCDFIHTDPFRKYLITRNDDRINYYKYDDECVFDLDKNAKGAKIESNKIDYSSQLISFYRNLFDVGKMSSSTNAIELAKTENCEYDAETAAFYNSSSETNISSLASSNMTQQSEDENAGRKNENTRLINVIKNQFKAPFKNAKTDEITQAEVSESSQSACTIKPPKPLIFIGKSKIKACKFALWSPDHVNMVLTSRHYLTFCDYRLQVNATVKERHKIKSGAWDGNNCFIYTTTHHLKYSLVTGQNGIIRTLGVPIYIIKVDQGKIHCFDTNGRIKIFTVDTTEYLFKLALLSKNKSAILEVFKNRKLVGQSIISYLDQNGFTNVALHFVKDPSTTFHLSMKIGKFHVALRAAHSLNSQHIWLVLANEALKWGNLEVAEIAYKAAGCVDKLMFLYLITGNFERMRHLINITQNAAISKDINGNERNAAILQNASRSYHFGLLLGDVELRVKSLLDSAKPNLAYLTAALHGCSDSLLDQISSNNTSVQSGKSLKAVEEIGDSPTNKTLKLNERRSVDVSNISFLNARRVFSNEQVGDCQQKHASNLEMFGIQVDRSRARFLRAPPPIQQLKNWPLLNLNFA